MEQKKFSWRAIKTDGKEIPQYSDDGSENLYEEVYALSRKNKIREFIIESDGEKYSVDIFTGKFNLNGDTKYFNMPFRILYFARRNRLEFNQSTGETDKSIIYRLGLMDNDYLFVISVFPDGKVILDKEESLSHL